MDYPGLYLVGDILRPGVDFPEQGAHYATIVYLSIYSSNLKLLTLFTRAVRLSASLSAELETS